MTVLDISSTPLDEGDEVRGDTFVDIAGALGDESGDVVVFAVPSGKGLVFQKWVERRIFGSVEDEPVAAGNKAPRQTSAFPNRGES